MGKFVDVDSILAKLSAEFIDDCLDNLDEADKALVSMRANPDDLQSHYDNLHRLVHSIKGTAGTFGFPAVGAIAHRLEDFMEALDGVYSHLDDIQQFLVKMREIAESGINPEGDEYIDLLRRLPRAHNRLAPVRPTRGVNILLVMPRDVQRKIIGHELSSCGFEMSFVANGVQAISSVLTMKPDVVISNDILEDMTGADLAGALSAIKETRGTHFVIMSNTEDELETLPGFPESVAIIKKEVDYTEALSKRLIDWGLFGGYVQSLK
ncbi:MAG: Hpt domain-containing protein [Rhodospirillales bacterium]|nr:Hpt domain-containing protein [Rhodospirillales bacterium]